MLPGTRWQYTCINPSKLWSKTWISPWTVTKKILAAHQTNYAGHWSCARRRRRRSRRKRRRRRRRRGRRIRIIRRRRWRRWRRRRRRRRRRRGWRGGEFWVYGWGVRTWELWRPSKQELQRVLRKAQLPQKLNMQIQVKIIHQKHSKDTLSLILLLPVLRGELLLGTVTSCGWKKASTACWRIIATPTQRRSAVRRDIQRKKGKRKWSKVNDGSWRPAVTRFPPHFNFGPFFSFFFSRVLTITLKDQWVV